MTEAPSMTPLGTKITQAVVMVDQTIALRWLEKNTKNRSVRQSAIARYRNDMESGRWVMAGDPIRFDVDGNLIDGQHRLIALSELENVTLPFSVVRGLPREASGVMDQGVKRTPGDQLTMVGVKNGSSVAASVKQFIAWREGMLFRDTKVMGAITSPQIEAWVHDHPHDVARLLSLMHLTKQNDAPPSIAGAAALAFARIDAQASLDFFTLLARGAGTEGHPIVTLDKTLQRWRRENRKFPNRDYLALFILAWNAWRSDRLVTKFQRPNGGSYSEETFPEPR